MVEKDVFKKKERGSVMVVALMLLAILTLFGISAARNSVVELKIAENDAAYRQALYSADSGISFSLRLNETDIAALTPGDLVEATPDGSRFQLVYLRTVENGPPRVVEIRSEVGPDLTDLNESLVDSKGSASIIAGIQLPTPMTGQIRGPGDEFEYAN